jgi:hypothetical protein
LGLLVVIALALAYLLALGLTAAPVINGDPSVKDEHWFAALAAIGIVVLFTVILGVLKIRVGGLVIGQDKRLSTSKLQALLWTYTLLGLLLAVLIDHWIGAHSGSCALVNNQPPDGFCNLIDKGLPEEYLILLGGPFAAAIASKAIVAGRVEDGTLTKPEPTTEATGTDRVGEAFSDDHGNTDLVDTQYLLFNFLAILYVIGGYIADPSEGVPSIPALLVGLTSVSAATYVSNKAVQRNVPVLTGVVPAKGTEGDPVRVFGQNLLVPAEGPDAGYHQVFVLFDGTEAPFVGLRKEGERLLDDDGDAEHLPRHGASGEDEVWVTVPGGLEARRVKVSVRNFMGNPSSNELDFDVSGD